MKKTLFAFFIASNLFAQLDTVKYSWPVKPFDQSHEIVGTFAEFRNTLSSDHFHNAVDIPYPDGEPVYPSLDGQVYYIVSSGSNAYVSVGTQIGNKWKRITYLHITPNPKIYLGKEVKAGVDTLGYIHSGMGHVHLIERELVNNISDYAVEINNLREGGGLTPYTDTWAPIIHENTLEFRLNNSDIKLPANGLTSKVDIIIKIEEQNGASRGARNNGTYIAGFRLWTPDTLQIAYAPSDSGVRYRFDRKPLNEDVHRVFLEGEATLSNPVYIITNGKGADYINRTRYVDDKYLNTDALPEGDYLLEIFSEDTRHNSTRKFFPITITRRDIVPPQIPTLLAVLNTDGKKGVKIIWTPNSDPDLTGYRLYYTGNTLLKDWQLAADETVLTKDSTSISFESPENFKVPTTSDVYFFYLTAVDSSGNESSPSDIYSRSSFTENTNLPKTLIVDGFDRYGGSGSWSKPTHSFNVSYFIPMTIAGGTVISSCANEAVANGIVKLEDYDAVIWFCGDESTKDNTFTTKEQGKVATYLINGGKCFVSGSEIGWDLDRPHTGSEPSDTLFYRHYLKARLVYDGNSDMNKATGIATTVFENLELNFGQVYPEDYPDDINPINSSYPIFNYNASRSDGTPRHAGIAYKGLFPNGNTAGAMVYLAFTLETVGSVSRRADFFDKLFEFFDLKTDVRDKFNRVYTYSLKQNYPNPFKESAHSGTTIEYFLPQKTNVTITIYNSLGQKISTLFNSGAERGLHRLSWKPRGLSSGIYFLQMRAGNFHKTIKMSLIK